MLLLCIPLGMFIPTGLWEGGGQVGLGCGVGTLLFLAGGRVGDSIVGHFDPWKTIKQGEWERSYGLM